MDVLVENGADLTRAGEKGSQPLSLAANKGYINVCRQLLNYGGDVDAVNSVSRFFSDYAAIKRRHAHSKRIASPTALF